MTRTAIHERARTPRFSVVTELRSLMPNRPLSFADAKAIAELQAARLLQLTDSGSPPVSEAVITELPRVDVRRAGNLIGSGASAWSGGRWHIRLNGAEPPTRQRFTLAHELKHILDAASEDVIYRHLPDGPARERQIEAVCDHFAASLLMPKAWVKRHWGAGVQDIAALAWRFEVSQQAMFIRLMNLGLIDPPPRHVAAYRLGRLAVRGSHQLQGRTTQSARPRDARPRFRRSSHLTRQPTAAV
ncbi:MAG: ImmA/IrrE family metallo-endopeptidase [Actinobacteria bacterium]|nr:ImmA/IrrE family metallo-endopeptidase [Actinomycetota bacterium]